VIIIVTACSTYFATRIEDGVLYVLTEDDRWSLIRAFVWVDKCSQLFVFIVSSNKCLRDACFEVGLPLRLSTMERGLRVT
jgi:hypothetical protein